MLQVSKQVQSMVGVKNQEGLTVLREAMGILQHHDAITGTEKDVVSEDYASLLYEGIEKANVFTSLGLE